MSQKPINLHTLIHWVIQHIIAFVRKHPFFSASLAVHCLVIYLLYTYGTYTFNLKAHQQASIEVAQSAQKAQQMDMQKRIDDMEKIKRLLLKSANRPVTDEATGEAPEDSSSSEKIATPKSQEDLLAKAKETLKTIKEIEKDIKAEKLAELLNIPKEEALKKVEDKIAAEQEKAKNQSQDDVKQMEAEARSTLEQRKQELDAQNAGVKISADQAAQKNAENTAKPAKGSGKDGQGENGDSDGVANQAGQKGVKGNGSQGDGGALADSNPKQDAVTNDQMHSQEIKEFLVESSYAMDNGHNFFDESRGQMPSVRGSEVKQSGRIVGAGGAFAERMYLNSWYVIGPFKGNSHGALYHNPSYPPEQLIDLDAVYFGKDERILKWQYVTRGEYPFVPPDLAEDAVYYGYTELAFDHAQDLWMWCGADDDLQVWLNNRLVWAGGNIAKQSFFDTIYVGHNSYWKDWNLTEGKSHVHLQQGKNKLLFKLSNGPNRFGVFASIILTQ